MPLVRITLAKGRPAAELQQIADGIHQALVETAGVPPDDRFQVIDEVAAENLLWNATYLGLSRSAALVYVEITLNAGRSLEVKQALYGAIAARLGEKPGLRADDVLVNLVEVPRENWSFGGGTMSYPPPR